MSAIDEQRLVLRAQEGSPRAFDELLRRYQRPLFQEPDSARLGTTREAVQSFIVKKKNSTRVPFVATLVAEALFLVLMLVNMDFGSWHERFLLFGFLLVYAPLILFSWHNATKLDHVYYRLIDELKYGERDGG